MPLLNLDTISHRARAAELGPLAARMFDNSYVARTGQLWKLNIGLAGLFAGGALAILPWFNQSEPIMMLSLVGIAIGLLSLIWLSISIRCPTCRTRLVWRAMSRAKHDRWLYALMSSKCPVCY